MDSSSSSSPSPRDSDSNHRDSVSVNLLEVVQTALVSLWEDHKYTDVTFLINGHRVPAHKAILASQSEYFDRMLFGELREASMDEITLQDVPLEAFKMVLQFAYSGALNMEWDALEVILEVVTVADRFRFVALKEALVDILSNRISLDTVTPLLVHSDTYHLPELHKQCLLFIESKSNTAKFLQSPAFLHLPEENLIKIISRDTLVAPELAIFKAVVQWKEHNNSSAEQTERVLQHIRLSEFPPQEIFEEVEPTGLFSEKVILSAIRLQHVSGVTESQGRGRKEANQNLFTMPKIVFDYTTPLSLHQPEYFFAPGGVAAQKSVTSSIIRLGFKSRKRDPSGSEKLEHCTIIVSFDDIYIVNYLHMKGYPGTPNENQKSFSYTVEVSRDESNWLKLFDYSSFACRSAQNLPFPKQAVKYIKVNLTGKEDTTQPVPLQLSVCCYEDNQMPFRFLSKGVIAPQYEQKVTTALFYGKVTQGSGCVVCFSQPYSASFIRFQLICSDPSIVEVDIIVYAGVNKDMKDRHLLLNKERTALQSPVVVEMQERVIGYVIVIIKKVCKEVDPSKDGRPGHVDGAAGDAADEEESPSPPKVDAGPVFKIGDVFCRAVV